MAINESKIVDLLWKKIGYGVAKTDDATKKSPSNESISSPLLIRGDRIWTQSQDIPQKMPVSSSAIVEVKSSYLGNMVRCTMDDTSTPMRTWLTQLTDWIPVEFGPTYQVQVYVDEPDVLDPTQNGTRLFADGSGSDEWYFDYSAGVLHFIGDDLPSYVTANKVIYVAGARYVGPTGLSNLNLDGGTSAVQGEFPSSQEITADGFNSIFTLTHEPTDSDAVDVYFNDVLQRPNEAYTITGTTLQFADIPEAGSDIYIKYRYPFATVLDNPNGSIQNRHLNLVYTSDQYVANGTQKIFDINPGHNNHSVLVIVGGLIQMPSTYTVNGTMLTFLNTPSAGTLIDIRYMPVSPL